MSIDITTPATALLEAIRDGLSNSVDRTLVQVGGEVAWDFTCSGQLSVRVTNVRPKWRNGPSGPVTTCPPIYWLVDVGVMVLRCVSVQDNNGVPPADSTITGEAGASFTDMSEVMATLESHLGDRLMNVDIWSPQGPNGGLAGGEWAVTMRVDA